MEALAAAEVLVPAEVLVDAKALAAAGVSFAALEVGVSLPEVGVSLPEVGVSLPEVGVSLPEVRLKGRLGGGGSAPSGRLSSLAAARSTAVLSFESGVDAIGLGSASSRLASRVLTPTISNVLALLDDV